MNKKPLQQRAASAVARKNARLRARMPLLAEALQPGAELAGWLATEATEAARLAAIESSWQDTKAALRDQQEESSGHALDYRELLAPHISADLLASLDTLPSWLAAKVARGDAAYLAEYWWRNLWQYAPAVAAEHCHWRHEHERWRAEYAHLIDNYVCPRCKMPLPATEDQPRQLHIGE